MPSASANTENKVTANWEVNPDYRIAMTLMSDMLCDEFYVVAAEKIENHIKLKLVKLGYPILLEVCESLIKTSIVK